MPPSSINVWIDSGFIKFIQALKVGQISSIARPEFGSGCFAKRLPCSMKFTWSSSRIEEQLILSDYELRTPSSLLPAIFFWLSYISESAIVSTSCIIRASRILSKSARLQKISTVAGIFTDFSSSRSFGKKCPRPCLGLSCISINFLEKLTSC